MAVVPSVPRVVKRFARPFAASGFQCWLVGGAVRDRFMRRSGGDYDLATDARPEQVRALYRHAIPTGVQHGTVTVPYAGHHIEVTTFRSESDYRDGRRPAQVTFASSIEEDLSRRDFTINGIAMEVPGGRIVDPFGGRGDLERRLIRAIGGRRGTLRRGRAAAATRLPVRRATRVSGGRSHAGRDPPQPEHRAARVRRAHPW